MSRAPAPTAANRLVGTSVIKAVGNISNQGRSKPVCKVCGTQAEFRDQEHFFFRLSAFREYLLQFLDRLHGTSNAKNYALGWIRDELHDWCITRTLEWGVKFPVAMISLYTSGLMLRLVTLHSLKSGQQGPKTGRNTGAGITASPISLVGISSITIAFSGRAL